MLHSLIPYLTESTIYLLVFLLIYRFFLSGLTDFSWMRTYLLGSLVLSLGLPLITFPFSVLGSQAESSSALRALNRTLGITETALVTLSSGASHPESKQGTVYMLLKNGLLLVYISGIWYRLVRLGRKLLGIRNHIRNNHGEKQDNHWIIYVTSPSPAYSFFNYIFISRKMKDLKKEELTNIIQHECIHANQLHTLDILFIELLRVLFWFNPLFTLYKKNLQEVHEYIADEKIINNAAMKKTYSRLLLKLTAGAESPALYSSFSAKQVSLRIMMVDKARSPFRQRFLFLLPLPAAAILLLSFSSMENGYTGLPVSSPVQTGISSSVNQMKVGVITWVNNTLYTDSQLTESLGIRSGDSYSRDYLEQRLYLDMDAASSLYLDNGYLFFKADIAENPDNVGTMDLTIMLYEGMQALIRNITIEGAGTVPEGDIWKQILIQPGELFSRSEIIQSVRAIREMGVFEPDNIVVNPIPVPEDADDEFARVDIEFILNYEQE